MIRKKLVFTEEDRREIKRIRAELNRMTLDSDSLSPIYAGGCGEQCMITCAHYCMTYCKASCTRNCDVTCTGTCGFECINSCINDWSPDNLWPYMFIH